MGFFKRSVIAAFIMILISGAVFAGGGKQPGPAAPTGGGATSQIVKPDKITVLGDVICFPEANGGPQWRAAFEKMTGIKVEFIQPAHNQYNEKVRLAFASGDLPDILEPAEGYVSLAVNGALYDVTDMFYSSSLAKDSDVYVADTIKINGRLYAVPSTHGNGCLTYVRQDWLDKLGLSAPKNWDEFYNLMVQFRDKNPAGAGQKTIPFIAPGVTDPMYLRDFYPGNNTQPGFFIKDNKIVEGMYDANTMIGFQRLSKAYKEGLIDQESVTHTTTSARDKFYTGNVGMFTYWAGTWNDTLQTNLAKNVPTADVEPMPPIDGSVLVDRPASWTMAIPAVSKNPQGLFKYYIELAFDRGDGMILFHYGTEGVNYSKNGGTYQKLPDLVNPTQLSNAYCFNPILTMYHWNDPFPQTDRTKKSLQIFNSNAKPDRVMSTDPSITSMMTDLNTARQEIVAKIVMGTYTPEDGVALYRKQYDNQVQQCLKVLNDNLK